MFSSTREPAVAVYPDSDKIGVFTPDRADRHSWFGAPTASATTGRRRAARRRGAGAGLTLARTLRHGRRSAPACPSQPAHLIHERTRATPGATRRDRTTCERVRTTLRRAAGT